jgi:hypothetical protein
MMTAKYFSGTSVPMYQTMWHHMPDDSNLFAIVTLQETVSSTQLFELCLFA